MIKHFTRGATEAGVVFWDLSRWARSSDDGQFYLSTLRRLGYQVHSLEQYIPPGSIGRVVESLHLWSAEEYRKQLSANIKRGVYYIVSVHHAYPYPRPPVGYRKTPVEIGARRDGRPHIISRLEPDPETAPRVARAFEMRAAGYSVAEAMLETRLSANRVSYCYMLVNKIYIGVFECGDLSIDNYCAPLVDLDTFNKVQDIAQSWSEWRAGVETTAHPRRVASPFLLSGLLRCGLCGKSMSGNHSGGRSRYRYYVCSSNVHGAKRNCSALTIRAGKIETIVSKLALEYISDDNLLQRLVDTVLIEIANHPEDDANNAKRLQDELAICEKSVNNLLKTLEMTGTSRAIADRLAGLERQRDDLTEQIAQAERQQAARRGFDPSAAGAAARVARLQLAQPDPRERQLALRSIIREIRTVKDRDSLRGVVVLCLPGLEIDTPVEFNYSHREYLDTG